MKDYSLYKGKEQTYLKHLVLENYLERLSWIIGFGSDYGKICYVDGFSGPWKSGSEDYADTSKRSVWIYWQKQRAVFKSGVSRLSSNASL